MSPSRVLDFAGLAQPVARELAHGLEQRIARRALVPSVDDDERLVDEA